MIKKLNELDSALWKRITQIVQTENRPFSYVDFVPSFTVDGQNYTIAYGTFRNKMSEMLKAEKVEVVYHSPQAFYVLKGVKFETPMTGDHTGVIAALHNQKYRHLSNDPIYRVIQNIPLGQRSLHDVHLRFKVDAIWSLLSFRYEPDPANKGIQLQPWPWKIMDLDIKVTVQPTDIVSVVIGCSYAPIAVDINGIIRLSEALAVVQERLSKLIDECNCETSDSLNIAIIPDHRSWIVTLWHFCVDALITYTHEKFYASWEVGQHALITAYTKDWKDGTTRIRIEKQEYPKKSLAEALEEKLNANTGRVGG
jgi:hypothetical protein